MTRTHQPYRDQERHPVFRDPFLGFRVTGDDGDVFVPCRITWGRGAPPPDWSGGGRRIVEDIVPMSGRVLTEDLGPIPLTLTAQVLFEDETRFRQFMAMLPYEGTLVMDKAYTRRLPDRTFHWGTKDYAEFDDVLAQPTGDPTFDTRGAVFLPVTFRKVVEEVIA